MVIGGGLAGERGMRSKQNLKLLEYVRREAEWIHGRLAVAQALNRLIPYGSGWAVRSRLYRWAGFRNLSKDVYIGGVIDLHGNGNIYERLFVDDGTVINAPCFMDLNGPVRIGKGVGLGHHVVLITSNHEVGPPQKRMGRMTPEPIVIGDGAWIGALVTILAGVTIGPGAMVAAGSVVTRDVPAHAKVAGNQARVIGWMEPMAEN